VLGDAVIEKAPDKSEVRLEFPLTRRLGRPVHGGDPAIGCTEVTATRRRLGLRDLVHLVLQRAGFNRWYPRMEGKRTWYVVRKRLVLAAREIETKGVRLAATCGPGGRPPPSCGCGTRCVGRRGQRD